MSLLDLQPNTPKAMLESYIWTVYGRPKAGKTSLWAGLVRKKYGGDMTKGLLIAFEKGYQAIKGVIAKDIADWDDFIDVADELVDEKENMPFKFLGFDTVDVMYTMACEFVVRRERIADGESYTTIGDIPYGAGYDKVAQEMSKQIDKLIKAGYGIMFLTHDQDKKFTSRAGLDYDKTTISLAKRARDLIVNMSDFIIFIDNATEKGGEKGKELVGNRYIYFRAEGTDLEAGSRFTNIRSKIPYDIDLFLETFEDAVLNSFEDEDVDMETILANEEKQREAKSQEFVDGKKKEKAGSDPSNMSAKELVELITKQEKELTATNKRKFKMAVKKVNNNKTDYTTIENADILLQLLEELKGLIA